MTGELCWRGCGQGRGLFGSGGSGSEQHSISHVAFYSPGSLLASFRETTSSKWRCCHFQSAAIPQGSSPAWTTLQPPGRAGAVQPRGPHGAVSLRRGLLLGRPGGSRSCAGNVAAPFHLRMEFSHGTASPWQSRGRLGRLMVVLVHGVNVVCGGGSERAGGFLSVVSCTRWASCRAGTGHRSRGSLG